ncbi:nuclear body protein [Clarias magur]|uniref:Nuclear body protein n=1 Tax=Clarias magur TaxID=1594786 RepID=A0A8J4UTV2_CLAMG|nr:nuclear body protein [Clarias magur]
MSVSAAGSRSKSIRTEERWFTPEEFVMQDSTLTDGHWKKHILYQGKTLNYLVKTKILDIHSQSCSCHVCCPKNIEPRYSSVIDHPIWLDKVKIKLQKNEYRTVGQFVNDINLIFNKCRTVNKV